MFRRLKEQSGGWKLKMHYNRLLISWSYLWLTNFSGDQMSKKHNFFIFDLLKNPAIGRSNNYFNFRSSEKWQNNFISWSKKLLVSCFDLLKFDLLAQLSAQSNFIRLKNKLNCLTPRLCQDWTFITNMNVCQINWLVGIF